MIRLSFYVFYLITCITSCGKKDTPGGGTTNTPPTNLTVSAIVNTNNSGNVAFTASATNAVSYDYDFGNGVFQTIASGVVTYRYTASGTYTVNVVAKSQGGLTISKSIQVPVVVTQALLWSDEFDVDGAPNTGKWGYDIGTGSNGWGNSELQYYTSRPENAVVQGGVLKIKAIRESFSGSAFTSAKLLSKGKFSFKYGKIETRAKLPVGVGTWPAIWTLGNNISTVGWPACGEMDIMEHRGSALNRIFGTLHYPGRSGGNPDGGTIVITNATTEFHIYSLEWTPSFIKIYVDDQLYHTVANSPAIPFNQDFYIILNVAMGGTFAGAVDPAFTNSTMEIDYVRVYQ